MIQIQNLHLAYQKNKPVFNHLNLELQSGKIYGLLGENGVGKSTLLKAIAGLVFPKSGQIQVLGYEPKLRVPAFLKQIFIIPEEIYTPPISIKEYVKIFSPYYPNFDDNLFYKCILDFNVDANAHLKELSFGQRKKVFISFGLATKTKLLLMDEPTNGLDIPSKAQFRKVMANALEDDRCFIISTHQIRDLDYLIDHLVVLSDHKLQFEADLEIIAQKLSFKRLAQIPSNAIYHEEDLNGYKVIVPNEDQEPTKIDIEMLFKATLIAKESFHQLFPKN